MTVIKTTVAKSNDVQDAALNLNFKAYELRRTLAAVWNLQSTSAQSPAPEATFSLDMKNEGPESVVGDGDDRVLVDQIHFAPSGKYRSIVKIFTHFEFQRSGGWAMGTGWLIKPDIFVTAGHCSYDWSHKLGRATEVKAYIGYSGHQSEKNSNVQFRHVKKIVTTEGWVKSKGQKNFDVSFMQVEAPFTGITPLRFEETPSQGSMVLGVVGYPGDLIDERTGEKGAHMYEHFIHTDFDLSAQADTMLEYQIDTFGGNSGSPVLREQDLVSIGAHVYGGNLNSASVIGKYGNPYADYIAAFGLSLPNDGLNLIPVTGNTAISAPVPSGYGSTVPGSLALSVPAICDVCESRKAETHHESKTQRHSNAPNDPSIPSRSQHQRRSTITKLIENGNSSEGRVLAAKSQRAEAEEQSFTDVLRTVASALPMGLGMGGGPIGALAGFVLNAASTVIAETGAQSAIDGQATHEGSIERAILAEATLSALQSTELPRDLEERIFSDMKDSVMNALPVIRKAAPHVMGAMMEPALKIALNSLHNHNQKATNGAESFQALQAEPFRPNVLYTTTIDQPADHHAENFLGHLYLSLKSSLQESAMDGDSREGFFDIIKAGVRVGNQGVLAAAKSGLPILANSFNKPGGTEGLEDDLGSLGSGIELLAAESLAQRALVADAALKAVMKMPPQQLQEQEFFGFIGDAVKYVAPIAMNVAPVVANTLHPTLGKVVSSVRKLESASVDDPAVFGSTRSRRAGIQDLSAKRSLRFLRDASAHGNGGRKRIDHPGVNRSQSGIPSRFYNQWTY